MANFTDYFESLIINYMRGTAPAAVGTLKVRLFVGGAPIEDDLEAGSYSGHEVSGGGYASQTITLDAPATGPSTTYTNNSAEILWNPASASWGTVTHFGITDASSNLLMWGALGDPKTVNFGDIFKFPIGSIQIDIG